MSGAQRLRLVLALGVVNLVLATVALGVRVVCAGSDPGRSAPCPTSGTALATTTPTAPSTAGPDAGADRSGGEPDTRRAPPRPGIRARSQTPGPSVAPSRRSLGTTVPGPDRAGRDATDRRRPPRDRSRSSPQSGQAHRAAGHPGPATGHADPDQGARVGRPGHAAGLPCLRARPGGIGRQGMPRTGPTSRRRIITTTVDIAAPGPAGPMGSPTASRPSPNPVPRAQTRHRLRVGRRAR